MQQQGSQDAMDYRVIYDVRDETGWFLLDPALLVALAWLVALVLVLFAIHDWLPKKDETLPEQVAKQMICIGAAGCAVCGLLLVFWIVGYLLGGPMNYPVGRLAWLLPSGIFLLTGWYTLRHPTPSTPLLLSTRHRLGLVVVGVLVATAATIVPWKLVDRLRERQAALDAGDVVVLAGKVTRVYQVKQGPRVDVAGRTFHIDGRPCGHLGREVWLHPGMPVRVTCRGKEVLRFEVATEAKPPGAR